MRAVDAATNTSAVTTATWTVDAAPPVVSTALVGGSVLTPAAWTAGCGTPATGDVCGTSSDAGTGVASVALSVRAAGSGRYYDGAAFTSASETWLAATGTTGRSYLLAASALPDDSYTVRFRATDGVGNATTGSAVVTLDGSPPPQPQLLSVPTSPGGITAVVEFTEAEADAEAETGATTQCRLDAAAWVTCSSPVTYTGLPAGTHVVEVRAVDAAGNPSPAARHEWVVDPDLPTIQTLSPTSGRRHNDVTFDAACGTPAGDVCGTASDPQGVTRVDVSLRRVATGLYWDGIAFSSSTEVWVAASGTTTWSRPFAAASFPAEGAYAVRARVTDVAGSTATDSVTMHVDRTPPPPPVITSRPSGTTNGADVFTFTGEPGGIFECRRDSGAWVACASRTALASADGSRTFPASDTYVLAARATDPVGNVSAPAVSTFALDRNGPTAVSVAAVNRAPSSGASRPGTSWC